MLEDVIKQYLYYPDRLPQHLPPPPWADGSDEIWIETSDDTRIHGLWWPEPSGKPALLFLHGNAQEVYSWSLIREELSPLNLRMLLIDYRGYGKSEGEPGEQGLYLDGAGAVDWLNSAGIDDKDILVFGKSLGGAIACELASNRSFKGLILESTFTSLDSVAQYLFPAVVAFSPEIDSYDSIGKIGSIECPLLVIHGENDDLIPVEEGKALFNMANEPRELFIVKGAGHNDVSAVAGAEYAERIAEWLEGI
ncbi:MAG: alpha/beta hydrolase [Actinobacteria bacterium]|nr:alpha/beta hydrolase [Actinomycetota bacterium]